MSVPHPRVVFSEPHNAVLGTKENLVTKKDYELIARVLNEMHDNYVGDDWTINGTIYLYANNLAIAMSKENPNFDMAKFMKACGA